jgi:hypothetical protein
VEPVLTDVVAIVTDAQEVLSIIDIAAQAFFTVHPELADKKKVYVDVMARTHAALDAAIRICQGATSLDQNQIDAAFTSFRAAYADLSALIQSFGISAPNGKLAAGPAAGFQVPAPLALTYHGKK